MVEEESRLNEATDATGSTMLSGTERSRISIPLSTHYGSQDRPDNKDEIPLKGLSTFNCFFYFFAPNREEDAKVNSLIVNQLEKFGVVVQNKLLVKTNGREQIDLTRFGSSRPSLFFEIRNITSVEGKELPVIRGSLNIQAPVMLQKGYCFSSPYVWTNNCFLEGFFREKIEQSVTLALSQLLRQFQIDYSTANPSHAERPVFHIFLP